VTRKRILVEFDVVDTLPEATLEVLNRLAETLDKLMSGDVIVEYGIQIEDPHTWIVALTVQDERDKTMRKYYRPVGEDEREEKGTATADTGYP